MAAVVITEASPEVVDQATKILESYHEHLLEARILWLFSNAKMTSQGEVLLGKGKKLSPEMRFLSSYRGALSYDQASADRGYDFVITVNQRQWSSALATQRTALLDHLLCYCDRKERINRRTGAVAYSWSVRGPDVKEFTEIVERHGLWRPSIKRFAQAMPKQLELPPDMTIEAKLPAGRTTTVDEDGLVAETRLEASDVAHGYLMPTPDGFVNSCSHGTPVEDSCAECVAEARERLDAGLPVRTGEPLTREQRIADLDAREAALDAPEQERMPDSWRARVGLGNALWGRARS